MAEYVVVGGAGFVGTEVCRRLSAAGHCVTAVDRCPPRPDDAGTAPAWLPLDLLADDVRLPPGRVLVLAGLSDPRPRRAWSLPLINAVTAARLAPALADRHVTLVSSVEVYGRAAGPLRETTEPDLPLSVTELAAWCDRVHRVADRPCPPWRVARLCQDLVAADPGGRWVYALSKAAQEDLIRRAVPAARLTVLRVANLFGLGQERVVARMARFALAGRPMPVTGGVSRSFTSVEELAAVLTSPLPAGTYNMGGSVIGLTDLAELVMAETGRRVPIRLMPPPADDSCGFVDAGKLIAVVGPPPDLRGEVASFVRRLRTEEHPLFSPPLPVVVPPRPEDPELVADRQSASQWSGVVKHGGPWTGRLTAALTEELSLPPHQRLVLTNSGTNALRLAVVATAGVARPGDVAVLPSFTFAATAEVLVQLGYALRFCDVDADTWTLDPAAVERAILDGGVRLVVAVDALGNPADYDRLVPLCRRAGVPLVADSAPALGSRYGDRPVGTQADAHAFSTSFAKVLSGAGCGGAVVVPAGADLEGSANFLRSALMTEVSAVAALDLLGSLEDLVRRREQVAVVYAEAAGRLRVLTPQAVAAGNRHCWVHWVARVAPELGRHHLANRLADLGVGTKPYYTPVHREHQPAGRAAPFLPVTELLGQEALALPMSSELTVEEAERVVMALDRIWAWDEPRRPAAPTTASAVLERA